MSKDKGKSKDTEQAQAERLGAVVAAMGAAFWAALLTWIGSAGCGLSDEPERGHGAERGRIRAKLEKVGEPIFTAHSAGLTGRSDAKARAIHAKGGEGKARKLRGRTATGRAHVELAIGDRASVRDVVLGMFQGALAAAWRSKNEDSGRDKKRLAQAFLGVTEGPKGIGYGALKDAANAERIGQGEETSFFETLCEALSGIADAAGGLPGATRDGSEPKPLAYGITHDARTYTFAQAREAFPEVPAPVLRACLRESMNGKLVTLAGFTFAVTQLSAEEAEGVSAQEAAVAAVEQALETLAERGEQDAVAAAAA